MGNTQMPPMVVRLNSRTSRRDMIQKEHEDLLVERGDGELSDTDKKQIEMWRSETAELDTEISGLASDLEAHEAALERSKALHKGRVGAMTGTEENGDGIVYRTMAAYARDKILTRNDSTSSKIQSTFSDPSEVQRAQARLDLLKRVPANTLSSNVEGLIPDQHINQIFQVIQTDRPIVASAQRANLERGTLTYPVITTRPVVAVQATEKTEAGNTGMVIDMLTATASTYLGGGDLSWQAVNWSTPNALDMWFRLAASDYALKTEQDAAQVLSTSAFTYNIATTVSGTPTFAELMTAIAAGGGDVYANSGRLANTLYVAPDRYWFAVGLTSDSSLAFGQGGSLQINSEDRRLNVVVSRGLDSGVMIVGDSAGLLVAETAGAPVELRVTEPAIGGYEVGIIGAFEAVVVDPGAFAMITTAS